MIVKAVGGALLMTACFLVGFGWTGSMRRKVRLLDGFCGLLLRMETELLQRGTPLAEMMEREGQNALAERLRAGELFARAAQPQLEALECLFGQGEVLSAAEELCWNLGRYDRDTQAAACSRARVRLEGCKVLLERELTEKQRLYHTVPVALGCILLLVIL